jgi:hypothetical protein
MFGMTLNLKFALILFALSIAAMFVGVEPWGPT